MGGRCWLPFALLAAGCVDLAVPPALLPDSNPGDRPGGWMDAAGVPLSDRLDGAGGGSDGLADRAGDGAPLADGPLADGAGDVPQPDAPPSANGAACVHGAQCASAICSRGVCCDQDCQGNCFACNVPGKTGTC